MVFISFFALEIFIRIITTIKNAGPNIHHFDLYRLGGTGGGRVSSGSRRQQQEENETSSPSSPSLSALDAQRCGLTEALGITSTGEEVGGNGGGGGVSLVEWADRLGSGNPPSSSSSLPSSPSDSSASFVLPDEERVLEVAIEPLEAGRAAEVAGRHPRLSSDDNDEEEKEDDGNGNESEEEEESENEFEDTRWRLVTLRPRGSRALGLAEGAARALREVNGAEKKRGRVAIEQKN